MLVTASEIESVNPLIAFTEIVEVPSTLTAVEMEVGVADREKSTKWKVTVLAVLVRPFPAPMMLTW